MPALRSKHRPLKTDRFVPIANAGKLIYERVGLPGWKCRNSIKKKIATQQPFVWIPGHHYLKTEHGWISSINVDAVIRELINFQE